MLVAIILPEIKHHYCISKSNLSIFNSKILQTYKSIYKSICVIVTIYKTTKVIPYN